MATDIYLDHGSGTPPHPAALEAARGAAEVYGDPLMMHSTGRRAKTLLEESRAFVAEAISAQPDEIVLTSGGTESVALALSGVAAASGDRSGRMLVSSVEHSCVMGAASRLRTIGFEVVNIPVDTYGRMDMDAFTAEVRKPGTLLASVQHSNHETGTLQPVAEVARTAHEAGVLLHTDACQSIGKLPVDVVALDVDLLSLSGHKFGGLPGTGALFARRGVPFSGHPSGDDRERHRRAGSAGLAGIAAMAAALNASIPEMADQASRQWEMTERVRMSIERDIPGSILHGHPTQRAPHLACFSVPGVDPEVLLMALDDKGYHVGIGSLSAGLAHDPSPVLEAMGAAGVSPVRIGVGRDTTDEHIDGLLLIVSGLVAELRKMENASTETLSRMNRREGS